MSRYIKSFENDAAIQSAVDNGVLSKPYVAYDESAHTIDWNTKSETDYSTIPFTLDVISGGTLNIELKGSTTPSLFINKNNTGWQEVITTTNKFYALTAATGDIIQLKGNNDRFVGDYTNNPAFKKPRNSTIQTKIYGNIMSLLEGDNYTTATTLTTNKSFYMLLSDSFAVDVKKLILPATTLSDSCYHSMFAYNTQITESPIITGGETLGFECTNLMFFGCTNLNYVKCLTTNPIGGYNWVQGVAPTGTFVKKTGVTWTTGTSGIPTNWTVQDA